MRATLLIFGAFSIGVGLERGWLPGVGTPFWVHLLVGSIAVTAGLMLKAPSNGGQER